MSSILLRRGLFVVLALISQAAFALEVSVSHTLFYKPDQKNTGKLVPVAEINWQVNPRTVHYTTAPDGRIFGRMRTDIVFSTESGVIAEDHFILQTSPRATADELTTLTIIGLRKYPITQGHVKIQFRLTDLADSNSRANYTDTFTVTPQSTTTPFFSGVQLLDTVLQINEQTDFLKNGRQQIPVAANFLDEHKTLLHYYAELYATDQVSKDDYPLIQRVFITKHEDEAPGGRFVKSDTVLPASVNLISGSFPIKALGSGNYYLKVTVENNTRKVIASRTVFFQRLNVHPEADADTVVQSKSKTTGDTAMEEVQVLDLKKTFIGKYSLAQVRAILKMLIPVSNGDALLSINGFLKKPDELYMRYFVYNHFLAIDKKNPEKAWKEYSDKIREVNKRFSSGGTPGYETERGFTFLRYGPPTDIVTVSNEKGALPYEVWQYNSLRQQNGKDIPDAVFLFYKPAQMMSDYRMLHSTVSGEVVNPQWRRYLYTTEEGGTMGNSRAEQYIRNR